MRYIGVDLHKTNFVVCFLSEDDNYKLETFPLSKAGINRFTSELSAIPSSQSTKLVRLHRSPRLATAAYGARLQQYRTALTNALAIAILDGLLDEREIPRYANFMLSNITVAKELEGSSRYEIEVERKQREWMKKKGIE